MSNYIELLNGITLLFTNSGITAKTGKKSAEIKFKDPGENTFVSLILLSANEKNLSNAVKIYEHYGKTKFVKETIIVGNKNQNKKILQKYDDIKFVVNPKPDSPIITSVKYALSCISNFSQYALICPVNKKILETDELHKFIEKSGKNDYGFAVPVINNRRMHPIIVKSIEFPHIRKIRKEQGLKYISKILFNEVKL